MYYHEVLEHEMRFINWDLIFLIISIGKMKIIFNSTVKVEINFIWPLNLGKGISLWMLAVQRFNSCTSRQDVCQCLVVQTLMDYMSKKKIHH